MTTLFGHKIEPHAPLPSLGRREHLTFRGNVKRGRHGWLRLTPAYSLHVVEEILEETPSSLVLDPFAGTGTTPLAAATRGIPAHAVDINPFLVWLSNLKTSIFPQDTRQQVRNAATRITAGLRRQRKPRASWVPDLHQIEKWWDGDTLDALARLFERIGSETESDAQSLLKIIFCRVLIDAAHVSFGHQSMSFKRPGRPAQLSLLDQHSTPAEVVWAAFLEETERLVETLQGDEPKAEARVYLGDSRRLRDALPRADYSIVITSPPYPNRMSYIRELRPYMYWLGYLTNGRQAGELDWKAIGGTWGCATSLLGTWRPKSENGVPYTKFLGIIRSINQDHPILARYVHKYFEDIKEHIESLRCVLAPEAKCFYVVGNSKFYGTVLPVQDIYAAIFRDCGFRNVTTETIRKRNSKKELFEYVVYAESP